MTGADKSQQFLDTHEELAPGAQIRFACHPGVPCFGACCSALDLMLTPYDVLRLRRALKIGSRQFVQEYADQTALPGVGLPLLQLHMQERSSRRCPFFGEGGCAVYPDRPSACRTYPLGRATRPGEDGGIVEQIFVMREPHCHGFEEAPVWTPAAWMEDQGLAEYNASNDRYMALAAALRQRLEAGGGRLSPQHLGMCGLALYQPDEFQRFLVGSGLLERLELDDARKAAVLADEAAALALAFDWLELSLLGREEHLKPKRS